MSQVVADPAALAAALAGLLAEAVASGGHVLLAGGTTPAAAYARMPAAPRAAHLWFGDERMVGPEHADSNFAMVSAAWLARVGYPAERVHRIAGERGAEEAARRAAADLRAHGPERLDLAILGVGIDGHTASLFPGDDALSAAGSYAPARAGTRVTATLSLLCAARRVVFVAHGAAKAEVIARIRAGDAALPAALVRGPAIAWLLDEAAAGRR